MPDSFEKRLPELLAGDRSKFYQRLVDGLFDAVYLVDRERRIAHWNRAAERLTGYERAIVCGRNCADNLLVHVDDRGRQLCQEGCPLQKTLEDGQPREARVFLRHRLGHRVPVAVRTEPVFDNGGQVIAAIEIFRETSSRRDFQKRMAELESLAFLDQLTKIPNRRYIETRFVQLQAEHIELKSSLAVMLVDVDHFKAVNDEAGHAAGDAVLISVARTLEAGLRGSDVAGRWGGDEFMVLLPYTEPTGLADLAERCRILISHTEVVWGARKVQVTASIGATASAPGESFDTVLGRTDRLLYCSKQKGRNCVSIE